ncbi:hypothetical protein EPO15_17155, partial [bacterium]
MSPVSDPSARRAAAEAAFAKSSLPLPTVETWRRFPREVFALERLASAPTPELTGLGAPVPAGAEVLTLDEAAVRHPGLVAEALAASAGPDFDRLEQANLARWRGGAFVRVPKGVKLAEPIHVEFVHDPALPYSFPRALVVLEEGAEAVVVEEHRSPASDGKPVSAAFSS